MENKIMPQLNLNNLSNQYIEEKITPPLSPVESNYILQLKVPIFKERAKEMGLIINDLLKGLLDNNDLDQFDQYLCTSLRFIIDANKELGITTNKIINRFNNKQDTKSYNVLLRDLKQLYNIHNDFITNFVSIVDSKKIVNYNLTKLQSFILKEFKRYDKNINNIIDILDHQIFHTAKHNQLMLNHIPQINQENINLLQKVKESNYNLSMLWEDFDRTFIPKEIINENKTKQRSYSL